MSIGSHAAPRLGGLDFRGDPSLLVRNTVAFGKPSEIGGRRALTLDE